jgi:CrcB protein
MGNGEGLTPAAVLLVALGGFLGATLRYAVGRVAPGLGGTFAVNVAGCVLLGALLSVAVRTDWLGHRARLVLGTGLLSSLTTYSTFAVESFQAPPALLAANVLGTYALGFLGVVLGRSVARHVVPTPGGGRP